MRWFLGRADREGRRLWLSFGGGLVVAVGALAVSACQARTLPDPRLTARTYSEAIERGDTAQIYAMLTERAAKELSEEDLALLMKQNETELSSFARELVQQDPEPVGQAELFISDRKVVELSLREGRFWVQAGHVLPMLPTSPEDATLFLREALLARDYERLVTLLSPSAKEKFETAFSVLDESLSSLDDAVIDVRQDRAIVELAGGRRIELRLIGDKWLVEEIR